MCYKLFSKKVNFFLKNACRFKKRLYLCTRNQQRNNEVENEKKAGAVVQFG